MSAKDPLSPLLAAQHIAQQAEKAASAIARVHRRPAGLRKFDVISSESLLRGARATAVLNGADPQAVLDGTLDGIPPQLASAISCYAHLAPDRLETTTRTWLRAPLQVLAAMSVSAGGTGQPDRAADRLHALAHLITHPPAHSTDFDRALPLIVHAEIAGHNIFGEESATVAQVGSRSAAIACGFDPRGFAIPENYLLRHRDDYDAALDEYTRGTMAPILTVLFAAWTAGANEADLIAQALR